jgi:NAD-dependent DNA ligase
LARSSWSRAGSKLKEAQKHNVQVVDEEAWLKLISG